MSCKRNTSRGCCFYKKQNDTIQAKAVSGCNKMETWDWLADMPNPISDKNIYEIHFKNTRKGFYVLAPGMAELKKGDIVTVESQPGHDVGIVSLTGEMVSKQMRRIGFNPNGVEFKKIIRLSNSSDIERWQEAISLEYNTMIRSREIVNNLNLNMKIGDVEYQGDRMKAIFYYIADQRVDFRELIKILAEQFRVRIEMKQIGARQEAGRIGGISDCGRELCCATWQSSFSTVTIGAARHQDISLNPQKLAGQCGKLKCCLNYEVDNYIDAKKEFPRMSNTLDAMDGSYHLVKTDILGRIMWYSPDAHNSSIMIPLSVDRVKHIINLNRKGVKVDKLEDDKTTRNNAMASEPAFENVVGQDSLTRFDKQNSSSSSNNARRNRKRSKVNGAGSRVNNTEGNESANGDVSTPEHNSSEDSTNNRRDSRNGNNRNGARFNNENRNRDKNAQPKGQNANLPANADINRANNTKTAEPNSEQNKNTATPQSGNPTQKSGNNDFRRNDRNRGRRGQNAIANNRDNNPSPMGNESRNNNGGNSSAEVNGQERANKERQSNANSAERTNNQDRSANGPDRDRNENRRPHNRSRRFNNGHRNGDQNSGGNTQKNDEPK